MASLGALLLPGGDLVLLLGDHCLNVVISKVFTVHARRVAPVRHDRVGCGAGPAGGPGDVDVLQGVLHHRAVVALASSDDHGQGTPVAVHDLVDLRGQPPARASNAVTCRLILAQRRILVVR